LKNTELVLLMICLQQGIFAFGWWVAGWVLGLPRRPAAHWLFATIATGVGLAALLMRGHWPDWLTRQAANLVLMLAFIAMRRGVQVFLKLRSTDREFALVLLLDVAVLWSAGSWAGAGGTVAVIGSSALIAWVLLRTAFEAHAGLRRRAGLGPARAVAAPIAMLGLLYVVRVVSGLLKPAQAARPLDESNPFNTAVVLAFLFVGLLLNLVLAYMVIQRLVSRLHHLSHRDTLTGLLNRRALYPLLLREAHRLRRGGEGYALLMIDIDHFKRVNDNHGHAAGDAALVSIAQILRGVGRELDQVARLGGEEFCLLLPGTDRDGALHLGQRVRDAVAQAAWHGLQHPLTVSVGVAAALDADEAPDSVMARADAALYRAKAEGRDRVVMAQPRVAVLRPA